MRPRTPQLCFALALALAGGASPTAAWQPETRVRVADEAIRLMPESLKLALQSHRAPLLRGLLAPLTGEDGGEHRPPWAAGTPGTLDQRVELEVAELMRALDRSAPFSEVAARFGAVAHYVMDAGFPPAMSGADGDRRHAHFSRFCESRRERFPLVFYGHDSTELEAGDVRGYAVAVMQRARAEDLMLARAYAAAGEPPNPAAFDDRSVPFAVGSLSYSRSFTDVVRVWLAAWQRAGGDMGRTPYLHRSRRGADREANEPDN